MTEGGVVTVALGNADNADDQVIFNTSDDTNWLHLIQVV